MTRASWKLFYDGSCNLCHQSSKRISSWAVRAGQPLDVLTLQDPEAQQKGYSEQMVLEADGRVYFAAEAWLRLMALAPWYLRWVALFRHTPPTRWLATTFYNFVARYRHFWLGRRVPGVTPCTDGG
jgi:predicted DCC family thiol-disulfide oxidoreductase YuxK